MLEFIEDCEENPSLIFLDMMMPKVDGYECAIDLERKHPPFPIVSMSIGGITPENLALLYRSGVNAFMPKARNIKELTKLVESCVNRWFDGRIADFPARDDNSVSTLGVNEECRRDRPDWGDKQ